MIHKTWHTKFVDFMISTLKDTWANEMFYISDHYKWVHAKPAGAGRDIQFIRDIAREFIEVHVPENCRHKREWKKLDTLIKEKCTLQDICDIPRRLSRIVSVKQEDALRRLKHVATSALPGYFNLSGQSMCASSNFEAYLHFVRNHFWEAVAIVQRNSFEDFKYDTMANRKLDIIACEQQYKIKINFRMYAGLDGSGFYRSAQIARQTAKIKRAAEKMQCVLVQLFEIQSQVDGSTVSHRVIENGVAEFELDLSIKRSGISLAELRKARDAEKVLNIDTLKKFNDTIEQQIDDAQSEANSIRKSIIKLNDELTLKLREVDTLTEKRRIVSEGITAHKTFTDALKEIK